MPEVGVCAKLTLVPIWTPADKIRPNRSSSQGMLVTLSPRLLQASSRSDYPILLIGRYCEGVHWLQRR